MTFFVIESPVVYSFFFSLNFPLWLPLNPALCCSLNSGGECLTLWFYSSVKLIMELGLLCGLTHFPPLEEVLELWLLLTFLCKGFAHQSDLLPTWAKRSEVICFVVLDFETKKTHWSYLVESFKIPIDFSVSSLMAWSSNVIITTAVKNLGNKIEPVKDTSLGWNWYPQHPKKFFSISQEAQANVRFTRTHLLQWRRTSRFNPEGRSVTLIENALEQTIYIHFCVKN